MSFTILNDVRQVLDPKIFSGGPWIHLATVSRARPNRTPREYMVFKGQNQRTAYIEILDAETQTLVRIEDDQEAMDVYQFCIESGLLQAASTKKEMKVHVPNTPRADLLIKRPPRPTRFSPLRSLYQNNKARHR